MNEKLLEKKLNLEVRKLGGETIKLTSQFRIGDPDRLVLMPNGLACFAEIKTTGKQPTKMQLIRHRQIRELGLVVEVRDSEQG